MTLPDLTLVTSTRELLAEVLTWRNDPDVTRWPMRTTVDADRFTQAWRVMEKVGMRREGHTVRDTWHAERGWADSPTYAMLAEEWRG